MSPTAELLDALEAYFRRFLILPSDAAYAAIALWTMHTHIYDVYDTTPYLLVTSAEKGSGKTRVFECLAPVVQRPKTVAALTEAVLFRWVSMVRPTLMIDETDTIFKDNRSGPSERQEGLRAILNAGYRRGTTIPRVLPNGDIVEFECYSPKALGGIGHLPETIEHRGLRIRMKPKLREETVEKLRYREIMNGTTEGLRAGLAAWEPRARLALGGRYPAMPDALDDRAQDAYEVLVAIADLAGAEWGARGRDALVELRAEGQALHESLGVKLLRDLSLIADRLGAVEFMETTELLDWLYAEGEQPWQEWWAGKDGSIKKGSRRLALALGEYGVTPRRNPAGTKRGYDTAPILAAVDRWAFDTSDTSESLQNEGFQHVSSGESSDVLKMAANPHGYAVSDVSDVLSAPDTSSAGVSELKDIAQSRVDELPW